MINLQSIFTSCHTNLKVQNLNVITLLKLSVLSLVTGTIISPRSPVIDHSGGNFGQRYSKALHLRTTYKKLLALYSFCCTPVYKKRLRLPEKRN